MSQHDTTAATPEGGLENLLREERPFPPSPGFAAQANAGPELYERAAADREGFWAEQARELLTWSQDFTEVLDLSGAPVARWFGDGKLNAAYNCLDRHLEAGHGDRVAIHCEGEPGDTRTLTYAELQERGLPGRQRAEGSACAPGDRVAIYLPMIPEAAIAMLACTRIGAPHSVVFGGFSAEALRDRINDAEAKRRHHRRRRLPARQGQRRSSRPSTRRWPRAPPRRARARRRRTGQDVAVDGGPRRLVARRRSRAASAEHTPVERRRRAPAVHPLHLGHHREAQGHRAHHRRLPRSGAHLTTKYVFDLKRRRRLLVHRRHRLGHRAQLRRLRPALQRRHRGDVRGRARPSAARTASGRSSRSTRSPSSTRRPPRSAPSCAGATSRPTATISRSLRLLGTVGEPINPEAWMWYHEVIGGERCPDRRHLVADRDRRHHDHAAARRHRRQARLRAARRCPASAPTSSTSSGEPGARRRGRLPRPHRALALDAARHLGRPRALHDSRTGHASPASTSPATAPRTRTATSGSSAASTT